MSVQLRQLHPLRWHPQTKKNPRSPEGPRGNTPVGVDGFEPPTLCL